MSVNLDKKCYAALRDQCFEYKDLINKLECLCDFDGLNVNQINEGIRYLIDSHKISFEKTVINT